MLREISFLKIQIVIFKCWIDNQTGPCGATEGELLLPRVNTLWAKEKVVGAVDCYLPLGT
jgi:hypothetical protein